MMCMISHVGKVMGLPVATAVDKEIYGDDVGRIIITSRLYFINTYINCCN